MERMKNRLFAMILTAMVAVSMTVPAFIEAAYAADGQDAEVLNEQPAEGAEDLSGEGSQKETPDGEEKSVDPEEKTLQAAGTEVGTFEVTIKKNLDGTVELSWGKVNDASYYTVSVPGYNNGAEKNVPASDMPKILLSELTADTDYSFTVKAYKENSPGQPMATGTGSFKTYKVYFDESKYRNLAGTVGAGAREMGINLRSMIGEGHGGYAVAQGSATDGTYLYHMLASSANQKGRIVKTTLSGAYVHSSPNALDIHHSNGMTYDKKRNRLVCVGYSTWRHELTYIDPDTLQVTGKVTVSYNSDMDGYKYTPNGIAAIAYVEKYDVYVTRERGDQVSGGNNDIMVFRPSDNDPSQVLNTNPESVDLVGYVRTKVSSKYSATYQSMDADEKYVYFLLSPGGNNSRNIILCLDWNSEKLLPVLNGEKNYIKEIWHCNNNGSGEPDAVITIPFGKESEGLCHTTSVDENGNVSNHFYVTEYRGIWTYKTKTVTEKYKVKWKKVKKKVKWKKVKRKGKWRWKYKKKKVWKYKTKTRKVKKQVKDTYTRNDYVYDLGVI